ncbi:hypothetical protein B0H11DRAFT_2072624 [Mycena galericulata]|nr:hypothetical protein B0H11DRAFT_2072624 [Mycena galericulata]
MPATRTSSAISQKRKRSELHDMEEPAAKRHSPSRSPESIENPLSDNGIPPPPSDPPKLPLDVLHEVFDLVIPPPYLLDPSLYCGPNSPWCGSMLTKRNLVSVSREWYLAGVHFMYRDIALRRVTAVPHLLRTLTAAPNLGLLVRSITFMCYVPPDYHKDIHRDMTQILKLCPAVTSVNNFQPFEIDPSCPFPEFEFPSLPPTVTSLKLDPKDGVDIDVLAKYSAQLEELSVAAFDHAGFDKTPISFPRLHTLTLTLDGDRAIERFTQTWDMPKLKRLTFRVMPHLGESHQLSDSYKHFLALHGRHLDYLAFPGLYGRTKQPAELVAPILALCPTVEHLVLPEHLLISSRDVHPNIKHIDVWHSGLFEAQGFEWERECKYAWSCPDLQSLRLLDTGLIPLIPDVPRAFPHSVRAPWGLAFPGLAVRQDIMHIEQERFRSPRKFLALPCVQLADVRAIAGWHRTPFGAGEMRTAMREQAAFKRVKRSGVHAEYVAERREKITWWNEQLVYMRPFYYRHDMYVTDSEPEDEDAFEDELHYYPDSDSGGSEDSSCSVETEEEDALYDEFCLLRRSRRVKKRN